MAEEEILPPAHRPRDTALQPPVTELQKKRGSSNEKEKKIKARPPEGALR